MFSELFKYYNEFHVNEIQTNRFQPEEFNNVLDKVDPSLDLIILGQSVEGRPIRMIKIGSGPTKVLMWSQMHGNESTATRAILDFLKLNAEPGRFKEAWAAILQKLTINIIPIINPDGTARFTRRNALGIDLNRDAREFECPESIILRDTMHQIAPDFSFNLHDQRRFYNIEGTSKPSTISFLAPAFDSDETVNESRLDAMRLISSLRNDLETVIPGQVGLYNDSFAPRAFGDYSQAQGSATILIESGWEHYDMEKEVVRKLNFAMLASALENIANGVYLQRSEEEYRNIPMNDEKLFDVLIRGVSLVKNDIQVKVDIGIHREELMIEKSSEFYSIGRAEDIGDLKEWYGFEEIKADELFLVAGKVSDMKLSEWSAFEETEKIEYIKQGFLCLINNNINQQNYSSGELINFVSGNEDVPSLDFEGLANFLLINKAGDIKYIVLNGFLWPIDEAPPEGLNGLFLR